ncbi:MAG: hypothetical protein ABS49_06300 [Erythrobacter sp. SCN 62-14]|nr:MAG: hypothetical protein ABS49_06300 [Erythrobacter sp. SCN 62-14]
MSEQAAAGFPHALPPLVKQRASGDGLLRAFLCLFAERRRRSGRWRRPFKQHKIVSFVQRAGYENCAQKLLCSPQTKPEP